MPEGRYIAPANSADCIAAEDRRLRAAHAARPRAALHAASTSSLAKKFPLGGRTNFEVRLDVLNVFDNINFKPAANAGPGATIFQVTTAYTI